VGVLLRALNEGSLAPEWLHQIRLYCRFL